MNESVKDLKYITKTVNFMKILWGTFEYQQKKMEHRFIPASQNKCALTSGKVRVSVTYEGMSH